MLEKENNDRDTMKEQEEDSYSYSVFEDHRKRTSCGVLLSLQRAGINQHAVAKRLRNHRSPKWQPMAGMPLGEATGKPSWRTTAAISGRDGAHAM